MQMENWSFLSLSGQNTENGILNTSFLLPIPPSLRRLNPVPFGGALSNLNGPLFSNKFRGGSCFLCNHLIYRESVSVFVVHHLQVWPIAATVFQKSAVVFTNYALIFHVCDYRQPLSHSFLDRVLVRKGDGTKKCEKDYEKDDLFH